MKKLTAAVILTVAGFISAVSGQETFTFTPDLTSNVFNSYVAHAAWTATIDGNANAIYLDNTLDGLDVADSTSLGFSLTQNNFQVLFSGQVLSGFGNPNPSQATVSINSGTSLIGLAIGISSPYATQYGLAINVNDLYVGSSMIQDVASTGTTDFDAALIQFSQPEDSFNLVFNADSGGSCDSVITIIGFVADPTPEPSPLALCVAGMAMFMAVKHLKR